MVQKTVVEQTKSVVPALHIKLLTTIESLEQQLVKIFFEFLELFPDLSLTSMSGNNPGD
jgi:hypothetical protein